MKLVWLRSYTRACTQMATLVFVDEWWRWLRLWIGPMTTIRIITKLDTFKYLNELSFWNRRTLKLVVICWAQQIETLERFHESALLAAELLAEIGRVAMNAARAAVLGQGGVGPLEKNDLLFVGRRQLTELPLVLLLETFIINFVAMTVLRWQLTLSVQDKSHQFIAIGVQVEEFPPSLATFGGATHGWPAGGKNGVLVLQQIVEGHYLRWIVNMIMTLAGGLSRVSTRTRAMTGYFRMISFTKTGVDLAT